ALVFGALVGKDFRLAEYLPLLLATVVIMVGSGVVGWLVARSAGIATKTLVPPMMFNNCGNLGLPLAVLAFGESALAPAVVMFVVSNVIHFSYGAWLLDHHTRLTTVWRSPSILATIAGLTVGFLGIEVWPPLLMSIEMVGDISIPLMLFALGVRLADSRISAVGFGLFGAVLRPVVGMALAWVLLQLLELPPREQALLLVFGALPPAVLNYMFAERYGQEPDKVASMVLIGNLAAVVFLPIALALVLE
ncbi:MAG: AEC family transporter, partial [Thauera sp.]|nr:AEC family transporter [Thauera sp.]